VTEEQPQQEWEVVQDKQHLQAQLNQAELTAAGDGKTAEEYIFTTG
jgi:hypothetical protein